MAYQDILNFWFSEIDQKMWWQKSDAFDQEIKNRFKEVHQAASQCELFHWRKSAEGRLSEIIVLDQFSRNMFRNNKKAFDQDPLALALAQEAVLQKEDHTLNLQQKMFLYMPYMHSESLKVHEQAVQLFSQPGLEGNLDFEHKHKVIIERFGRYPHRNDILGRTSTSEEIEFLKGPNSSF